MIMKNSRRLLFRILTVLVLLAIAAAMYVIGRGHTLYFDNTSMEYNGQTIEAPYRIDVYVGGERVAKLKEDERGTCTNIGQKFSMDLEITKEKDDEPVTEHISLKLPFSIDNIVVNLPALLQGLDEDAYYSVFVPLVQEPSEEEPQVDEFGIELNADEESMG